MKKNGDAIKAKKDNFFFGMVKSADFLPELKPLLKRAPKSAETAPEHLRFCGKA